MIAACTIVSPNYLAFARVLAASYLVHHPDHRVFVLIVADTADSAPFTGQAFTPVLLHELGLADLRGEAMKYDILELNTNVKPAFMAHLLARYDLDRLVYLDPDILVTSPLTPVFAALDASADAVLTPHITAPIHDDRSPSEQDHLYNGTYNLGFIAVRRSPETTRLLQWWSDRCLALGFSEGRTGLFVDQKWMNLAPALFAGVHTLRDPGCNMAYWNLQERTLRKRPSQDRATQDRTLEVHTLTPEDAGYCVHTASGTIAPLCFFHFSGIDPDDPAQLSRNTDRFTLAGRPDLQPLFAFYRSALGSAHDPVAEAVPYGFDRLSDGTVVTRLARRIYSRHQARWRGADPFDAAGPFARFARRHRLLAGKTPPAQNTWRQFNRQDRRVLALHRVLRATLRLLGPNRYELLMRYLAHIAVLRNQSIFLDDPGTPRGAGDAEAP